MPADTHGLEAIRKSSDQRVPGDRADNLLKTADHLSLMKGFLSTLTYNRIDEEKFSSFTEYQIYNDSTLVDTLRIFEENGKWRVKAVIATSVINTEASENLTQQNGGKLLTE